MAKVLYEFQAFGYGDVRDAFVSIGAAAQASGATVERAAKKQTDVRTMTAKQAASELERIRQKENDALAKALNKEIAEYEKAAAKKIAAEQKVAKERQRAAASMAAGFGGIIADAGINAFKQLATAGANLVGGALRESFSLQDISRRISIMSRKAGGEFQDPDATRKIFEKTAIETPGIKSEDIAHAADKYISLTGDVQTAMANMKTFATVASATGANVADVAEAAASLGEQFDVKSIAAMQKTMALLTFQGKEGAFELKDMAKQFQRLAAAAQGYGLGKGTEGVQKLGGFLQVARGGTGSGAAAATAAERVFSNLDAKRGAKLESQYGIEIYKDRKLGIKKNFNEVIGDVIAKGGGMNVANKTSFLNDIFGAYGKRATAPLFSTYKAANEAAGGGAKGQEAGRLAVIKQLEDAGAAAANWTEIQKDAAFAQQSASARLAGAWESVKAGISESLVPAIEKSLPELLSAIPQIADGLKTLGGAAADAAKALGLFTPKTQGEKAGEAFTEGANSPVGPVAGAKNATGKVALLRNISKTGQKEQGEKEHDTFVKNFGDAGGGGIGDKIRGRVAAFTAEHPNSYWTKLIKGQMEGQLNPKQEKELGAYTKQFETRKDLEGKAGAPEGQAGKLGDMAVALGESAKAQAIAAKAMETAAQKMGAAGKKPGGTIMGD